MVDLSTAELLRTEQHHADGSTFVNEVRSRAIVDDLRDRIKNKLGTERVEKIEN